MTEYENYSPQMVPTNPSALAHGLPNIIISVAGAGVPFVFA